jgi:PTH1 family peptidyl-tRNA hydrolase
VTDGETGALSGGPWLVVGLGNPGPDHAADRHNAGAMVLDELAERLSLRFTGHKARAAVAEGRLGVLPGGAPGPRVVLAKPSSWMNTSGGPVAGLVRFFSADPERVVVVHDELDVDFGVVRLKRGGGEGGHNGLRDITKALGTKDYVRVRVGIGRPPGRMDPADFVLHGFSATERKELPFLLADAADAVELVVTQGLDAAQQRVHAPR